MERPKKIVKESFSDLDDASSDSDMDSEEGQEEKVSDEEDMVDSNEWSSMDEEASSQIGFDDEEDYAYLKKQKRTNKDNEEADYEIDGRHFEESDEEETRLPVIDASGKLKKLDARKAEDKPVKKEEPKKGKKFLPVVTEKEKSSSISLTKDDIKAIPLKSMPEKLAEISTYILENPEDRITTLKTLRDLTHHKNVSVMRLGILAQLAVYKDIIPGYRIRALTDEEKKIKVSKDIKKLRDYEQTLLSNYQSYLKDLEKLVVDKDPKRVELKSDAIRCMAELLVSVTHFNFRSNLMSVVVNQMNSKNAEIAETCCKAMSSVFKDDISGDASLEGVRLISKLIKDKKYIVNHEIVRTFLALRLKEELSLEDTEDDGKKFKKRKKHQREVRSKKMRKLLKEKVEVDKQIKEAEAEVDQQEKRRKQTETVKHVFITYFRILKDPRNEKLLAATLEGLSEYAHLINIDFFTDLMASMKRLMEEKVETLKTCKHARDPTSALHCVVTVFTIMTGQGEALNIDLKDFLDMLYAVLGYIPAWTKRTKEDPTNVLALLLKSIDLAFCHRKQVRTIPRFKR